MTPTNIEARLVDRPEQSSIFVSRSRVRQCYDELDNVSWSGHSAISHSKKRVNTSKKSKESVRDSSRYWKSTIHSIAS